VNQIKYILRQQLPFSAAHIVAAAAPLHSDISSAYLYKFMREIHRQLEYNSNYTQKCIQFYRQAIMLIKEHKTRTFLILEFAFFMLDKD